MVVIVDYLENGRNHLLRENQEGIVGDSEEKRDLEEKEHLSTYPVSRLAPPFELVNLAEEIARADDLLAMQTSGKLKLLAKQIRALQDEAISILEETRRNQELHRAECSFAKKAGQVYHLYRKRDGQLTFSMLSPTEWGERQPFAHEGSYRLESDMSWTLVDGPADE